MKIEELRATIEKQREHLKNRPPAPALANEKGPVGISIIDALMIVIEDQQQRIEALEKAKP